MPEIKNTFLKSKMNKDLDSRIIPNGEYRDAKNVSISRSEGSDVGSLENVLGNIQLTDLKNKINAQEIDKIQKLYNLTLRPNEINIDQLEIIGYHAETSRDLIFLFLTDYRDTSSNRLSNFASSDKVLRVGTSLPAVYSFKYKGACCYIVQYNVLTSQSTILVAGSFLNFSKTHPINNVNLLEDLLFFTDNRNQPRKINITRALNNPWENSGANNPYYYNEDHISVAKYSPVYPFEFIDSNNESTLISNNEEFLPVHIITTISQNQVNADNTVRFGTEAYQDTGINADYAVGDRVIIKAPFLSSGNVIKEDKEYIISQVFTNRVIISGTFGIDIDAGSVVHVQRKNPKYNINYKGDVNLLKEEFSKFSYRFKYDDDEYSLMSPFTQSAFIPKQFGYFIGDDEDKVSKSGNVAFMENIVDQVKLNLTLPCNANELQNKLKVKELQILVKNSDEQSVRVVEDVDISKIASLGSTTRYEYNYLSSKPIKTLPEAALIRVHDKTPIKALTQEVIANRVVYGNFQAKHGSPSLLTYDLNSSVKNTAANISIEHPCHTLKQNRSYQVGIVLVDRYGRASNVILNDIDNSLNNNSTIYIPYKSSRDIPNLNYFGNIITLALREKVPNFNSNLNYPGLYSETNPLGYYSYRIVVKQQEQDYYNVYTPGAIAGDLTWNTIGFTKQNASIDPPQQGEAGNTDFLPSFNNVNDISLINLFGDNINKVPRELKTSSNANDNTFGSETILFNRVNPLSSYNVQSNINKQGEKVVSIEPFRQLGDWTTTKGKLFPGGNIPSDSNDPVPTPWYPYHVTGSVATDIKFNFYDIFFKSQSNPFIAKIETDFKIGVTPTYNDKSTIESAWQDLGVFETKPTKSVIDIYYETSSSDLISNLNQQVASSGYPAGVQDQNGNNTAFGQNINYFHLESDNPNISTVYVTSDFQLVDASGAVINTNSDLQIDSVTSDGGTRDLTGQFDIVSGLSLSDSFRIILKPDAYLLKYFSSQSPTIDNYTFILKATDIQNSTPNYVNVPIQITNCQMQNIAPSITGTLDAEYEVRFTVTNKHTDVRDKNDNPLFINGPLNSLGTNLIVKNGSADDFLSTKELVFKLIDDVPGANPGNATNDFDFIRGIFVMKPGLYNNFFDNDGGFPTLPPNTEVIFSKGQVIFNYDVRLKVTDANGAGLTVESVPFRIKAIYSFLRL